MVHQSAWKNVFAGTAFFGGRLLRFFAACLRAAQQTAALLFSKEAAMPDEEHSNNASLPVGEKVTAPDNPWPGGQVKSWLLAAMVVLVFFCLLEMRSFLAEPTVRTGYGEVKQQLLADGTLVMLNAKTDLNFINSNEENPGREVWLKGEAWFRVKPGGGNSPMTIHTAPYDIVVKGGSVNVVNRTNQFRVYVQQGEVSLKASNIDTGNYRVYRTGELVTLTHQRLTATQADTAGVLAWKEKKISLNRTPLMEVASMIGTLYGVEVTLPARPDRVPPVTGVFPNTSLIALLKALEGATRLRFTLRDNRVLVQPRN